MSHLPCPRVRAHTGAGFDGVDLDAARRRGIVVANGSGVNAETVAQHAFALMLATMRDFVAADRNRSNGGLDSREGAQATAQR